VPCISGLGGNGAVYEALGLREGRRRRDGDSGALKLLFQCVSLALTGSSGGLSLSIAGTGLKLLVNEALSNGSTGLKLLVNEA